jgi:proteasome accessory factor B
MSFRARMQRIAFIHRRLKHKRDYPSARELAEDYLEQTGDGFSERALSSYRNSPYYERLRSVFDRLTRLLPEKVTVHTEDLAQNVTIVTEPVTEIGAGIWQVVQSCLEQERSVAVFYRKPGYESSAMRVVDPYHIVGFRGEWYLIGYSHHDEEVRIYALGRFTDAKTTAYRFDAPADFDPAEYIDPAFGVFLGGETRGIAVRFDPAVASKIRERQWHPEQEIEEQADGGIILRFRTNQSQQTLFWVSQWGPNAEILEPADLREQAAAWTAAAAARYRSPS